MVTQTRLLTNFINKSVICGQTEVQNIFLTGGFGDHLIETEIVYNIQESSYTCLHEGSPFSTGVQSG